MGTAVIDQDPVAAYKAAKAATSSGDAVAAYRKARGGAGPITAGHSKFTPAQLIRRAEGAVTDAKAEEPNFGQKVLGTLAATAKDAPFGPELQAGLASHPLRTLSGLAGVASGTGMAAGAADLGSVMGSPEYADAARAIQSAEDETGAGALTARIGMGVLGLRPVAKALPAVGRTALKLSLGKLGAAGRIVKALPKVADALETVGARTPTPAAPVASGALREAIENVPRITTQSPIQSALQQSVPALAESPKSQFEGMLRRALDESQAAAKAGPESTDWGLMERMVEGLKPGSGKAEVASLRAASEARDAASVKQFFNELRASPQWKNAPDDQVLQLAIKMAKESSY